MKDHQFTLGIEEEFAIIDPKTRELKAPDSSIECSRHDPPFAYKGSRLRHPTFQRISGAAE
ncbi:MAG: hypothetical protein ACJ8KU_07095 [Chthoniobacterales bacterium]